MAESTAQMENAPRYGGFRNEAGVSSAQPAASRFGDESQILPTILSQPSLGSSRIVASAGVGHVSHFAMDITDTTQNFGFTREVANDFVPVVASVKSRQVFVPSAMR